MFINTCFLLKLGAGPFYIWLSDVYEGAPFSSTIFFTLCPKIVYLVVISRLCYLSFFSFFEHFQLFFVFCGVISVLVGSLNALNQKRVKRLLVYSSITHIGFVLLALSSGSLFGLSTCFLYLFFYILNNILVWGLLLLFYAEETKNLNLTSFSRILSISSFTGFGLVVGAFSLAGIPPLSGFFLKLYALVSAFSTDLLLHTFIILLLSIIGVFYYIMFLKIICFENKEKELFTVIYSFKSYELLSLLISFSFSIVLLFTFNHYFLSVLTYKMCVSVL